MPSIEHFRQFLVLAEYLNYSSAAESLFISQPALSRHIAALEASLNIKLLERTTQNVTLTPAGALFKERITALLDDYDDITSRLRILKSGYSERLRISCPYYAINDYLGNIPEQFITQYPQIKLQYSMGDPYEAMQTLLEDRADIAIIPNYHLPHAEALQCRTVFTERLGVLLSRSSPLAEREALSLRDLQNETFFNVGNSYFSASWRQTMSLCRSAGFLPKDPALFGQMEEVIMAIRNGDGVIVIGRHMRVLASEHVAFRPLLDPACEREVSLWFRPNSNNDAIEKFVRLYSAARSALEASAP